MLRIRAAATVGLLLLAAVCRAADTPPAVYEHLKEMTVQVKASSSYGTGVLVKRGDHTFVLTAAHVVTRGKPSDGDIWDVYVVEHIREGVEDVGETRFACEVLQCDEKEDIAVLRVRKKGYGARGVKFYLADTVPGLRTRVHHCGNFLAIYHNIVRSGEIDCLGVAVNGRSGLAFDNASCVSFAGSSGGPVVNDDEEYVGMITCGAGETLSTYIPIRRLRKWANTKGLTWLLNPGEPLPASFNVAGPVSPKVPLGTAKNSSPQKIYP